MKRYRKPTIANLDMMTVKQHNWLRRVAPLVYSDWLAAGSRLIKAMTR